MRNSNALWTSNNIELSSSFRKLCENLEELSLLFVVSSHKLFMELLKEEERKVIMEQMRKKSATINLSAKPLPSFYDIPGAPLRLYAFLKALKQEEILIIIIFFFSY